MTPGDSRVVFVAFVVFRNFRRRRFRRQNWSSYSAMRRAADRFRFNFLASRRQKKSVAWKFDSLNHYIRRLVARSRPKPANHRPVCAWRHIARRVTSSHIDFLSSATFPGISRASVTSQHLPPTSGHWWWPSEISRYSSVWIRSPNCSIHQMIQRQFSWQHYNWRSSQLAVHWSGN